MCVVITGILLFKYHYGLFRPKQRSENQRTAVLQAHAQDNENGWTPLHEAAAQGDLELAARLLKNGADINAINKPQDVTKHIPEEPPLHIAARKNHFDMVKLLIEHGADINQLRRAPNEISVLHNALEAHNKEMIEYLLEHGSKVTYKKEVRPIIMEACVYEVSNDIIGLLIKYGADVNEQDETGLSALMIAAFLSSDYHVEYLLKQHASVHLADHEGHTALHRALQTINSESNVGIAYLILEHGADMHYTTGGDNPSAFELAEAIGHEAVIEFLKDFDAQSYQKVSTS